MDRYLSICSQFRDEAPYLREWVEFHRLVGVEHFFLYDHFSADESAAVLAPYVEAGVVTLTGWSSEPHNVLAREGAHDHCLATFGATSRWIAFIDVDEFLFAPAADSLAEALGPYEPFPGVFVNWQIYGSSGHILRPSGLVTENYTRRAPTEFARNLKGKSIVDPRRAAKYNSAHYFLYRDGGAAVTENFEPVHTQTIQTPVGRTTQSTVTGVSVERLRINHYCVKSQIDYQGKGKTPEPSRYDREFFAYHDRNEVVDTVLCRYLPRLKAALASGPVSA